MALKSITAWPGSIYRFYRDGFRGMTVGKSLWVLIIVKLALFFLLLKLFFFPDILSETYDNDNDRAEAVRSALIDRPTATP